MNNAKVYYFFFPPRRPPLRLADFPAFEMRAARDLDMPLRFNLPAMARFFT